MPTAQLGEADFLHLFAFAGTGHSLDSLLMPGSNSRVAPSLSCLIANININKIIIIMT